MISGTTTLIPHLGFPTTTFQSSLICNPWFAKRGIDAAVVPLGVRAADFAELFPTLFRLSNVGGALVTMPHKVGVLSLVDEVSPAAAIAGAANAVLRRDDGRLVAEQFDGAGFLRGMLRRGFDPAGRRGLVLGSGGVGSAIVAALAQHGVGELEIFDQADGASEALARRVRAHYPDVSVLVGGSDPEGFDFVVNATPLGMAEGDPLPLDVTRLRPGTFVGDVILGTDLTPLLQAARERGCEVQFGSDMLFELVPAYLEFFGFPGATPDELRELVASTATT